MRISPLSSRVLMLLVLFVMVVQVLLLFVMVVRGVPRVIKRVGLLVLIPGIPKLLNRIVVLVVLVLLVQVLLVMGVPRRRLGVLAMVANTLGAVILVVRIVKRMGLELVLARFLGGILPMASLFILILILWGPMARPFPWGRS